MILNGVMTVISGYFTEFGGFGANYVTLVELDPHHLRRK